MKNKKILITGAAGFIGFHISQKLLKDKWNVIGLDNFSDYYDISLKKNREKILLKSKNYLSIKGSIQDPALLEDLFVKEKPNVVIHLAAQAGVRYSIDNPRAYLESNIIGSFELLEAVRKNPPEHVLIASTSSAYGANKNMPYKETDVSDHQMSFYAATKKSTENMAHSYSHLFKIPITVFRFFTVYGPWGRPDMALFKFTKAILNGQKIDIYNFGNMERDFTYIDDLVQNINRLIDCIPNKKLFEEEPNSLIDSKSPVAPFRVVNIGNSSPIKLMDFLKAIEVAIGKKAIINFMPMQAGDIPATWANTKLVKTLTGYKQKTSIDIGVTEFVKWFRYYYKI
jgi:UDP-glucuronate 4-epimerase